MNRLRQAAQTGDIYELYNAILEEEDDVLSLFDEVELVETPLHIAANRGHADFAMAMMGLKPSFGRKLNKNIYSPMQLALQNGHKQVVLDLLAFDKDLVRVKGREGYTVLHYVAENGDVDLSAHFLKDCPACIKDVTIRNETALHLAVKYNKLEVVKILARYLRRTHLYCNVSKSHLLNLKDRNGNTALHIAASNTQPQMIEVLIECRVDTKEINNEGFTALDILEMQSGETDNREICLNIISKARKGRLFTALSIVMGDKLSNAPPEHANKVALSKRLRSKITIGEELLMPLFGTMMKMSAGKINALLVVVTLILTATYQAMLSPPGGVWQGDYPANTTSANNHVGESVTDSSFYGNFCVLNFEVFAFTSCLTVGLINAVTKSHIAAVLCELLLSLLMLSLVEAQQVLRPESKADPPESNSTIKFIIFFLLFLLLESITRLHLFLLNAISKRFFVEFFSQDM